MGPQGLSINDFTYALPEDRIARHPLAERDASRLLVCRDGVLADHHFRDLPKLLPANSLLVLNDTRVINARIIFHRHSGARIEVLCLEPAQGRPVEEAFAQKGHSTWHAFVGNAKRWKHDEELELRSDEVILRAVRSAPDRMNFSWEPASSTFAEILQQVGHVPLPPYMHRPDEAADKERYNTVFARSEGSVAAPTASLHFTPQVLEALAEQGIATAKLTLHVGAGTFLPVKSEHMVHHTMHSEQVRIPLSALEQLAAQLSIGPLVAVGSTALRTLESVYWHGVQVLRDQAGEEMTIDQWVPYTHDVKHLPSAAAALQAVVEQVRASGRQRLTGSTRLLIAPGYAFRFIDGLITNFHQPQSTLLLLVAAFLGPDWRKVYAHALDHGYRFLSYGDGSLLWRSNGSP